MAPTVQHTHSLAIICAAVRKRPVPRVHPIADMHDEKMHLTSTLARRASLGLPSTAANFNQGWPVRCVRFIRARSPPAPAPVRLRISPHARPLPPSSVIFAVGILQRFVMHMLHSTPDGGLAVSTLGPVSATLPSGASVNVTGDYPFDDDVTVSLTNLPAGALTFPLYIRVPAWATNASLSVNGAPPQYVGAQNGTMLRVTWAGAVGPNATVTLFTNPAVRVEPWFNGALAVFRGALLYSLRVRTDEGEEAVVVGRAGDVYAGWCTQ